jgi:hypothetical protein
MISLARDKLWLAKEVVFSASALGKEIYMHSLYPIADYQTEVQRRHDEMVDAENYHLANQCPKDKKIDVNLPLRLVNFLLLLVPFIKR